MPGIRRGIPASQLARDYGVSLNEFSEAIMGAIGREWAEPEGDGRLARRREVCAAVSAAMLAALEASMLSAEERDKVQPLIEQVLSPFWTKHCGSDNPALAAEITARAEHYLAGRDANSRVKSAVAMVNALLDSLQAPAHLRPVLLERLTPAFAHRMVGDVYRINDVRRRYGIELSMLATVCALLQVSLTYDPILRALRIG